MPNRLAHETSPYLLQHQNNPVDWQPWGSAALEQARREDKPIFLSIGYSACHWCHVMEHESFESEPIARYLNEHFVSIKVDREERPDLDQIYMNAVQLLTGRGGWPMSVFLTPELKPFFGGTYWPPEPRMGMPGFEQVLAAVHDAWQNRRENVNRQADELTSYLQAAGEPSADAQSAVTSLGQREPNELAGKPGRELLRAAAQSLRRSFDSRHGGFGTAPKFPHSMDLQLLLRIWRRERHADLLEMVTVTLDKMAAGGIYDHLAGGFARYSVDERWLVPHFEKMLYDNALLTSAYLDACQATGDGRFLRVVRETCDYILAYMTDPAGGFHSTEDADSEGEEGKFYVWTPAEIKQILGDAAGERFCYVYDVSEHGNFEHGQSILNLPKSIEQVAALRHWNAEQLSPELAASRAKLLAVRDQRIRPGKDDKILVSWNALMIDALAKAGVIVGEPRYLAAASRAAAFLTQHMMPGGRLLHTWRHGQAKLDAYLDDYAYLANALVTLYEATYHEPWIDVAVGLADQLLARFEDKVQGGFFFTANDHEALIARNKDLHDASVPSASGMAATALIRLGKLTGRADYLESAGRSLQFGRQVMERSPAAAGQMLIALDMWLGPMHELVLIGGSDQQANRDAVSLMRRYAFLPNSVRAYRPADAAPARGALEQLFSGRTAVDHQPTLYICENFACQAPLVGLEAIRSELEKLTRATFDI